MHYNDLKQRKNGLLIPLFQKKGKVMKKIFNLILSVFYAAFAVATLFAGIELVQNAYGNPMLSPEFWETETMLLLKAKWEVNNNEFLIQGFILMQVFCVILHLICALIGRSIMKPSIHYDKKSEFRGLTRRTFLISRIAHLIFAPVFVAHIFYFAPGGNIRLGNGEFVLHCLLFVLPGLVYFIATIFNTIAVILLGKPNFGYNYCNKCNHGCFKQFEVIDSKHLYDEVSTETTTTKDGYGNVNVSTRETGRRAVHRNTYSCKNCKTSFKKVE